MMNDAIPDAERIGRYIDGEMDAVERMTFEQDLAKDPALAEQLARLTDQNAQLRAAFELSVDDALLARLGLSETSDQPQPSQVADVIDFATAKAHRVAQAGAAAQMNDNAATGSVRQGWRWAAGAAMAAVIVLAVALPLRPRSGIEPLDSPAFQVAMESIPSQTSHTLGQGAIVVPQLSFADQTGRFCREYALGGSESGRGIACRTTNGRWTIEAQVNGAASPVDGSGIRTAAGDGTAALDTAYTRLGASDPFDATKENSLLANAWRSASE